MALTIAEVSTPQQAQQWPSFGNLRGRVVDITFPASYTTGGDTLTAAALGLTGIMGIVALSDAAPSGLATKSETRSTVAANGVSATLQLFAGSAVDSPQAYQFNAQPQATAGSDLSTVGFTSPVAGTITSVTYTPLTTFTGAVTNARHWALNNTTKTLIPATFVGAGSGAAFNLTTAVLNPLTLGIASQLVVTGGDIFTFVSTHDGTGLADPGGTVVVTIAPAITATDLAEIPSGTNVSSLTGRFLVLGW